MTQLELIQDITNELTFAKALPYSLPEQEIVRIITIGTKYFYDNWRHAVEERYLVIPTAITEHPLFKKDRSIRLPDCVAFVHQVKEAKGGGSLFGTVDLDFADNKFIGAEIFISPFIGESIMYQTIMFSFLDLVKAFTIDTIAFNYNKNSHLLGIMGRNPQFDMVLTIAKKIEPGYLYEDELFQRYVRAKCKLRLVELLTTFDYNLPGGVKVNYQSLTTRADKELDEVMNMMKNENTPDFLFLERF